MDSRLIQLAAASSRELNRFHLSRLISLHTFRATIKLSPVSATRFIDWITVQLQALPAAHPLRLLILDVQESSEGIYVRSAHWTRLDEVLQDRGDISIVFNIHRLQRHRLLEYQRSIMRDFPLANVRGQITFGFW